MKTSPSKQQRLFSKIFDVAFFATNVLLARRQVRQYARFRRHRRFSYAASGYLPDVFLVGRMIPDTVAIIGEIAKLCNSPTTISASRGGSIKPSATASVNTTPAARLTLHNGRFLLLSSRPKKLGVWIISAYFIRQLLL